MSNLWAGKVGALRCPICNINYPFNRERFSECPVCGVPTDLYRNLKVDEDWLLLAETMVKAIDGEIPDYPPTQEP